MHKQHGSVHRALCTSEVPKSLGGILMLSPQTQKSGEFGKRSVHEVQLL